MGTPLGGRGRRASIALLSSPAGAGLLARTLTGGYRPIASAAEARGAKVIVVLGSGSVNLRASGRQLSSVTAEAGLRVLEAARLFELLNGPLVIASGGVTEHDGAAAPESVALQRALIDARRAADRIVLESESKNTRDEAIIVKRMLAERGLTDFVLVTSPLHMRRSMLAFEQQGMHPIPSPSPLVPDRSTERSRCCRAICGSRSATRRCTSGWRAATTGGTAGCGEWTAPGAQSGAVSQARLVSSDLQRRARQSRDASRRLPLRCTAPAARRDRP